MFIILSTTYAIMFTVNKLKTQIFPVTKLFDKIDFYVFISFYLCTFISPLSTFHKNLSHHRSQIVTKALSYTHCRVQVSSSGCAKIWLLGCLGTYGIPPSIKGDPRASSQKIYENLLLNNGFECLSEAGGRERCSKVRILRVLKWVFYHTALNRAFLKSTYCIVP